MVFHVGKHQEVGARKGESIPPVLSEGAGRLVMRVENCTFCLFVAFPWSCSTSLSVINTVGLFAGSSVKSASFCLMWNRFLLQQPLLPPSRFPYPSARWVTWLQLQSSKGIWDSLVSVEIAHIHRRRATLGPNLFPLQAGLQQSGC